MIFIESKNPNLFNPVTMINYEFPMTSDVELSVYNLFGQKVVTLVNWWQGAGYHQVEWDASKMASGIYLLLSIGRRRICYNSAGQGRS